MIMLGQRVIVKRVIYATKLLARMRGLLGYTGLGPEVAMVIAPCSSIHTIGMRFPLDVIFLDPSNRVLRIVRQVRPGRLWVSGGWRSRKVIESEAGCLDLSSLRIGDQLSL